MTIMKNNMSVHLLMHTCKVALFTQAYSKKKKNKDKKNCQYDCYN